MFLGKQLSVTIYFQQQTLHFPFTQYKQGNFEDYAQFE